MTTPRLPENLIRVLLITPPGGLWDTVRPMSASNDDALAVVGVTVLAQSVIDARLALSRVGPDERARAAEVESVLRGLLP